MEKTNNKKGIVKTLNRLSIKIIDRYIIRKFLGTFTFSLLMIIVIAVVFDLTEKLDDFMEKEAPLRAIIFDYYLNFIPYFATIFSPLFVFISVIFFTSRMAVNTEIIAILSGGMSFRRMMWPYFIASLVIAIFAFTFTNFVIPQANLKRIDFENKYYRITRVKRGQVVNFHRQVYKNVYMYMERYNPEIQTGTNFTLERFDDSGRLESKLTATRVTWDTTTSKWSAWTYYIRDFKDSVEVISRGLRIDTALTIRPEDFSRDPQYVGTMRYKELNDYIGLLRLQGSDELKLFLIEKHRRFANPFSVFILTLIGVSLSSKKIRGGIGMQIGIGLALSFSYILFMQFASQFSLKGNLDPMLAMWIPNILYLAIALFLYRLAPK
ncbi:MAG TPA: LptF/LptG family permease [Bacteroidales bacterium]|nr:LptF/LptG family permease [Bacteroidales bacterium]HOK74826.1 LptF/LptG family permease [Bacteroidales bacterium]HOU30105.1 LptF/LptG family permease [Bacteroidales bacterium]HPP93680.1 LptF/LptG family permease [Bacteroidales bacterium]HQG56781.1 LptF/LptG family permease [Bacteroidales bacterium]